MKKRAEHLHTVRCGSVYQHLCEHLETKLDSASCRKIKAHLLECPNCSALLDSLKKTVSLYRRYPTPALPARSRKKLIAVIRYSAKKKSRTR